MNFFQRYQTIIIFVVVVGLLYGAYTFFFAGSTSSPLTTTTTIDTSADQDLISLLLELKGIRLDNTIFTDPLFATLQDFSRGLVQEPVGRNNPFAPFGTQALTPPAQTPTKPAK